MSRDPRDRPPHRSPSPEEPSSVRERTRKRMVALGGLAAVAAMPLVNTACDPAPEPYCYRSDPTTWLASVRANATWVADGGVSLVELRLTTIGGYPLTIPEDFTVVGGTLQSTSAVSGGVALLVAPAAGATSVRVEASVDCEGSSATPFSVTLDVSGSPVGGAVVPTTIE